jgi:hypothetical protein
MTMRLPLKWALMGALVLVGPLPSQAGHYELDPEYHDPQASQPVPVCTGSLTIAGGGEPLNQAIGYYENEAQAQNGTISGGGSFKWYFRWVPAPGETMVTDPPESATWEFTYSGSVSFAWDPWAYAPGAASGTISLGGQSAQASATFTPAGYGEGEQYTPAHLTPDPAGATLTVVLEEELSGSALVITHEIEMEGEAQGDLTLNLKGGNPRAAPKRDEQIWHEWPNRDDANPNTPGNQNYRSLTPIQCWGKWRGLTGHSYKVTTEWHGRSTPADWTAYGSELGPWAGKDATNYLWSASTTITPDAGGGKSGSKALLKCLVDGDYVVRKTSVIEFVVTDE